MNPRRIIFLIFIGVFSWLFSTASYGERAVRVTEKADVISAKVGTYRALIIGIDQYEDPKIPDLETAVNDAQAMADILRRRYGFDEIKLLLDREASKRSLVLSLRDLVAAAQPDDSVLIYYSGHGDLDRLYNDGWWIPADAKAGDPLSYLDNIHVQKAIKNMQARHVLLVSDSCYSGTLFGTSKQMPEVITDKYYLAMYKEKSRWGMTSGNRTPVADYGTEGHSIFAYHFLRALTTNSKPFLTAQEIYTQIGPVVANNSEQTPLCQPIRNTGDQGGNFVFLSSVTGSIRVKSTPPGALILADGRRVGTAPVTLSGVMPGKVMLEASLEGYEEQQESVWAQADKEVNYEFILKPVRLSGALKVRSDPPGARWYLDGAYAGVTPDTMIEVGQGGRRVLIKYQGYEDWEREVTVEPHKTQEVIASLKKRIVTGSISVAGEPSGARWYLDGNYVGMTPGRLEEVEPGNHRITIKKQGYQEWSGQVDVAPGKEMGVRAVLEEKPAKGAVIVLSEPPGAYWYLDGKPMGTTPGEKKEANDGLHRVTVKKQGYEDWTQDVRVAADKEHRVLAELRPRMTTGKLVIKSTPPGAQWYFNEEYRGTTNDEWSDAPQGTHRITVKKEGFQTWTENISVQADKKTMVTAKLTAFKPSPVQKEPEPAAVPKADEPRPAMTPSVDSNVKLVILSFDLPREKDRLLGYFLKALSETLPGHAELTAVASAYDFAGYHSALVSTPILNEKARSTGVWTRKWSENDPKPDTEAMRSIGAATGADAVISYAVRLSAENPYSPTINSKIYATLVDVHTGKAFVNEVSVSYYGDAEWNRKAEQLTRESFADFLAARQRARSSH